MGACNLAKGTNAHAEGSFSIATEAASHAEGSMTTASGSASHAEGGNTIASGLTSHAEGAGTTASGNQSHAEGGGTTASKSCSHAEGGSTTASGDFSHAEGASTTASSNSSHAEGSGTTASGAYSHAEGEQTTALGQSSHAEGANTTTSGMYSHAEGFGTVADGNISHAEGSHTITKGRSQHVFGEYNIADTSASYAGARGTYIEIAGNGTADNVRSNVRTLDWTGNEWIRGNLKMGGNSYDDPNAKELATKEYVDEHAGTGSVTDVKIKGTSIVDSETGEADIPIASANKPGLVYIRNADAEGINMVNGNLSIYAASESNSKLGNNHARPIVTSIQHISVFYGLAKAAGDTTQSQSSNAVGTYTEEAKLAIRNMIDATGESATITVSGTDPVIQATRNTRYMCGEVLSLSFTPSASGICEVIFTAGSTLPVITLPETVKMPEWFEIETDHTYEISIVDGVYGAVMVW